MIAEAGLQKSHCYSSAIVHAQSQLYLDMFKFRLEECPTISLMSQITVYTQRVCLCCKIKEHQGDNSNTGSSFAHIGEWLFWFLFVFFFLVLLQLALCRTKSLDIVRKIDRSRESLISNEDEDAADAQCSPPVLSEKALQPQELPYTQMPAHSIDNPHS